MALPENISRDRPIHAELANNDADKLSKETSMTSEKNRDTVSMLISLLSFNKSKKKAMVLAPEALYFDLRAKWSHKSLADVKCQE